MNNFVNSRSTILRTAENVSVHITIETDRILREWSRMNSSGILTQTITGFIIISGGRYVIDVTNEGMYRYIAVTFNRTNVLRGINIKHNLKTGEVTADFIGDSFNHEEKQLIEELCNVFGFESIFE